MQIDILREVEKTILLHCDFESGNLRKRSSDFVNIRSEITLRKKRIDTIDMGHPTGVG